MTELAEAQKPEEVDDRPCPLLWRVLVEPLAPKEKSAGGILLPEETQNAEEYNTSVGQVVAMGASAFSAKTKAGIDLSEEPNRPTEGSWVLFGRYAGQKITLRDGRKFVLLDDTDILSVVDDPSQYRAYL